MDSNLLPNGVLSVKVYLASRYSRREELCGYREELKRVLDYEVTSRWLNGAHQISDHGTPIGGAGEALVEGDAGSASDEAAEMRKRFAWEDISDLLAADTIIAFTEPPRSSASRGGRHVEWGIALGINCFAADRGIIHRAFRLIVVGPRENLFHWLDEIEHFETWHECFESLGAEMEEAIG